MGAGVYLMKNLSLTLLIFTLLGCGEIERISLTKEQKEWRKIHLSNETEIVQKCMRLNNKYTPQNKGKIIKYEKVKYKKPFFYVRFYESDSRSYSTCHVLIGYRYPEYSFSKNYFLYNNPEVYVGEDYLCDYLDPEKYGSC